jgi:serine protease inhibitor ecotin
MDKRTLIKFHRFSSKHNIDVGLRLGDLVQKKTTQGIIEKKRWEGWKFSYFHYSCDQIHNNLIKVIISFPPIKKEMSICKVGPKCSTNFRQGFYVGVFQRATCHLKDNP